MERKKRRFGSKVTTTHDGKNEYQKEYMREVRKRQKAELVHLKEELLITKISLALALKK